MNFLNTGVVIAIACYIYWVGSLFTKKIADITQSCKKYSTEENKHKIMIPNEQPSVLVFGANITAEYLITYLKSKNYKVYHLKQINYDENWRGLNFIIALSDSDAENLEVCSIGRKIYHVPYIAGICNEDHNKKIFHESFVTIISKDEKIPERIFPFSV